MHLEVCFLSMTITVNCPKRPFQNLFSKNTNHVIKRSFQHDKYIILTTRFPNFEVPRHLEIVYFTSQTLTKNWIFVPTPSDFCHHLDLFLSKHKTHINNRVFTTMSIQFSLPSSEI